MSDPTAEIAARLEAVGEPEHGSWIVALEEKESPIYVDSWEVFNSDADYEPLLSGITNEPLAEFIAHAPADIAFLLGRVRELEAVAGLVVVTPEATEERWIFENDCGEPRYAKSRQGAEDLARRFNGKAYPERKTAPEATVDDVAQHIRFVDGAHNLGAARLADALLRDFTISPRVTGTGKDN